MHFIFIPNNTSMKIYCDRFTLCNENQNDIINNKAFFFAKNRIFFICIIAFCLAWNDWNANIHHSQNILKSRANYETIKQKKNLNDDSQW